MVSIFINACHENGEYFVDVRTLIIIYLYKLSESNSLKLSIKILTRKYSDSLINLDLTDLEYDILTETSDLAKLCTWPVILLDNYVVSGLCSVARQICKLSPKENIRNLLGFREACLVACAESSVWTRFCEIDIIETISNLLNHNFIKGTSLILPEDILKYENHLSKPVRIHNIYKIARNNQNDQSLKSSTPREELQVLHDYAEGPYVTLADNILYLAFQIFFEYCQKCSCSVEERIPLISCWFSKLGHLQLPKIKFSLCIEKTLSLQEIIIPCIANVSLYNADPTRIIPVKHTNQNKIVSALNIINNLKNDISNSSLPLGFKRKFNWEDIPIEANPKGGALPKKRADRKCEQLENMAKATLEVVENKTYRIVDFCSGSGHLGILIATLLPNCEIILVENKEMSLDRARETISKLKLNNVIVVQSNLDYFMATFNLGIALHACGVATDLVLQMCIKNKADFVCCPCCYGGIKDCHEISYPRSNRFRKVFGNLKSHYFNLAHAADQTHEEQNAKTKQGYFCMDVIDTDRKFLAEDCGYRVHLGKLQPVTCTNKNNLLVGIYVANVNK